MHNISKELSGGGNVLPKMEGGTARGELSAFLCLPGPNETPIFR